MIEDNKVYSFQNQDLREVYKSTSTEQQSSQNEVKNSSGRQSEGLNKYKYAVYGAKTATDKNSETNKGSINKSNNAANDPGLQKPKTFYQLDTSEKIGTGEAKLLDFKDNPDDKLPELASKASGIDEKELDLNNKPYGPILKNIYGEDGIDWGKERKYYEANLPKDVGGFTKNGEILISKDDEFYKSGSFNISGLSEYENYGKDRIIINEASHKVFDEIVRENIIENTEASLDRSLMYYSIGERDIFSKVDSGVLGLKIPDIDTADEFISDAASINLDARDIFKVIEHAAHLQDARLRDGSIFVRDSYDYSSHFMKNQISKLMMKKGMEQDSAKSYFKDIKNGQIKSTDLLSKKYNFTKSDLSEIQKSYMRQAQLLATHLKSELGPFIEKQIQDSKYNSYNSYR